MKSLLIAALLLISMSSFSKNIQSMNSSLKSVYSVAVDVPQAVLDAFNSQFPNARNVVWHKEDHNRYEADYFLGAQQWKAAYKADGTLVYARKTR